MMSKSTFPSAAGHVTTTTLLADVQTFPLLDIHENLCPPASLRYKARLLVESVLAQNGPLKRATGTISFVRASSEPVT